MVSCELHRATIAGFLSVAGSCISVEKSVRNPNSPTDRPLCHLRAAMSTELKDASFYDVCFRRRVVFDAPRAILLFRSVICLIPAGPKSDFVLSNPVGPNSGDNRRLSPLLGRIQGVTGVFWSRLAPYTGLIRGKLSG